ncbi:MAG TPA: hypothetical protein VL242_37495 [Sorangium sp.]|nr:hypothetical protein [Sorangium sp.]
MPTNIDLGGCVLFDGDGERRVHLHRISGEEETAYHDQHLTLRDGRFITKHIYAGQTRTASKMDPDWLLMELS